MRFINETTDQVRVVLRRHISGDEPEKNFVLYPGDEVTIQHGTYTTEDVFRAFEPDELERWNASKEVGTSPVDLTRTESSSETDLEAARRMASAGEPLIDLNKQRDIDTQKKAEGLPIPGSENFPADATLTRGEMDITPPPASLGSEMAQLGEKQALAANPGDPSIEAVEQPATLLGDVDGEGVASNLVVHPTNPPNPPDPIPEPRAEGQPAEAGI
jgi:hypothetical protein